MKLIRCLCVFLLSVTTTLHAVPFTVTNTNDSGAGSLRQTLADAVAAGGQVIVTFDASLNGLTIVLTGPGLSVGNVSGIDVDATSLSNGLTIQAPTGDRVLANGGSIILRGLTLSGANVPSYFGGGAVYNYGTLTLELCTLSGNNAGSGGGLFNDGTVTMNRCTISGNTANSGSALYNRNSFGAGSMTLNHCTITGNTAAANYSVSNDGTLLLKHCTVAGNLSQGNYGGMANEPGRTFTIENSIIGGELGANTGLTDIYNGGTLVRVGANVSQKPPVSFGSGTITGGGTIINAPPQLLPLKNYGGRTRAMLPQNGSPAIDAAVGSTEAIDQRGKSRPLDGDGSGTVVADVGAVEVVNLTVTSTADNGAASLRKALADAAGSGADSITFGQALSGQTITMISGPLVAGSTHDVTIDATALPGGIVLDGNYASRVVVNNGTMRLRALTLARGFCASSEGGGGVLNYGTVTLERCTLRGNSGGYGSAFFNDSAGIATLRQCTVTGSTTYTRAAIENRGALFLTHCTIASNIGGTSSKIFPDSFNRYFRTFDGVYRQPQTLAEFYTQSTLCETFYTAGIFNYTGATLTLDNSIVTSSEGPASVFDPPFMEGDVYTIVFNIQNCGQLFTTGSNIVRHPIFQGVLTTLGGDPYFDLFYFPTIATNVDPQLSPLDNHGGPVPTILPLAGSPAIDASIGTTATIDQRGLVRPVDGDGNGTNVADLGAAEFQNADRTFLLHLSIGEGTISPAFSQLTSSFTASVPYAVSSITVTPTGYDASSAITVNGAAVASGATSSAVPISLGANVITIAVTAPGGGMTRNYTITVTRLPSAYLTSLTLSPGTLIPAFEKATMSYDVSVPNGVSSFTITPITEQPGATITANGMAVVSGSASGGIPLQEGANIIAIVVTSPDGGTVKTYNLTVRRAAIISTTSDNGPGSIRKAILDGANAISFAPALSGQQIALTSGPLVISSNYGVTIDGSGLSGGVTINGNGSNRVFVNSSALTLRALTLSGGFIAFEGGAILNTGTLSLERCTFSGNTAGSGGALYAGTGATTSIRQCTFAGNTASGQSGAIENRGTMTLTHCTVAANTAPLIGGIFNYLGSLTIENCIVAANSGGLGNDINNQGTLIKTGVNIVQAALAGTGTINGTGVINSTNPLLLPLANYEGPNATMPIMAGSPAIDIAVGSAETIDQRGYARPADGDGNSVAVADPGAVEFVSSDRAFLYSFTLSTGNTVPTFAPVTTSYSASVPYAVTSIAVTSAVVDPNATITVNGTVVASGTASGNLPLNLGTNLITTIVTAPGGAGTKTYQVTITRLPTANLSSLSLSAGTLTPPFAANTTTYSASVPFETSSISVTPAVEQPGSTIKVNGATVASGFASSSIPLNLGANTVTIVVTNPDGITTRTYALTVTRLAGLSGIGLSAGALDPALNNIATSYAVSVPFGTSSISVTPSVAQSGSAITVNGVTVASGSASGSIPLNPGANIVSVVVAALDGTTTRTYTLTVRRPVLVTTTANQGVGSLRQALLADPDLVLFDAALSGQTITLTGGPISCGANCKLVIDASALPGGLVINGNQSDRVFVNTGMLTLRALTITGGFTAPANAGGGLINYGNLTMERCTLMQNVGGYGGAIWNNTDAVMTLRQCTVAANSAATEAGAIENRGALTLSHCTIAGNSAPVVGGVYNFAGAMLIDNTIVAGNTGSNGADISNTGMLTRGGTNIVQAAVVNSGSSNGTGSILNVDPHVLPLAYYGGPVPTMLLATNSPAIDAAPTSSELTDQRGIARPADGDQNGSSVADIGAVEFATSDRALLRSLTLSTGVLSPTFNTVTSYTATVANEITSLTLTPTAAQATAAITVNGVAVASGSASGSIPITIGTNAITVVVMAAGGAISKTYNVSVTRLPNTYLAGIAVSAGTLSPAFNRSVTNYSVAVPVGTSSIIVTPTAESSNVSITINGTPVASGNASAPIAINEGGNSIAIVLSNPDGGADTRIYTITVSRPFVVTTTADSGAGSLRQAMFTASAIPGEDTILFDSALSGQTISVVGNVMEIQSGGGPLTIDATALPAGITIDGFWADAAHILSNEETLTLRRITFAHAPGFSSGGAVHNEGALTVERCTFIENEAGAGGAIFNAAGKTATVRECFFMDNVANGGGAIFNAGTITIERCAFSGNAARSSSRGGAILNYSSATATISHSTIVSTPQEFGFSGPGVAIANESNGNTTLIHCTLAGHAGELRSGVANNGALTIRNTIVHNFNVNVYHESGMLTLTGLSIIPSFYLLGPVTGIEMLIEDPPLLSPFGNYGGPTSSMPLMSGSPGIDTAFGSTATIDQRGFARPVDGDGNGTAIADIGAVESGSNSAPLTPIEIWRQANFGSPANAGNGADLFDFDHDGLANLLEFAFGLNPTRSDSLQLPQSQVSGGYLTLQITEPPGVSGVGYGAEWSTTLQANDWHTVTDTGAAPQHIFTMPVGTNKKMFMRFKITNP